MCPLTPQKAKTIAELSQEYKVHPTSNCTVENSSWIRCLEYSLYGERKNKQEQELLTNELYQQIGQLKVELDWLKKSDMTLLIKSD